MGSGVGVSASYHHRFPDSGEGGGGHRAKVEKGLQWVTDCLVPAVTDACGELVGAVIFQHDEEGTQPAFPPRPIISTQEDTLTSDKALLTTLSDEAKRMRASSSGGDAGFIGGRNTVGLADFLTMPLLEVVCASGVSLPTHWDEYRARFRSKTPMCVFPTHPPTHSLTLSLTHSLIICKGQRILPRSYSPTPIPITPLHPPGTPPRCFHPSCPH